MSRIIDNIVHTIRIEEENSEHNMHIFAQKTAVYFYQIHEKEVMEFAKKYGIIFESNSGAPLSYNKMEKRSN